MAHIEGTRRVDAGMVFAHPAVDVGDIEGHRFPQSWDLFVQRLNGSGEQRFEPLMGQLPLLLAQPASAGDGAGHVKAVGLGDIEVQLKAQFHHEQGFEVGRAWMGTASRRTGQQGLVRDDAPVQQSEQRTVVLHEVIVLHHVLHGGLVKGQRIWYDRHGKPPPCREFGSRINFYIAYKWVLL
jgi:hypothetical protein